jgi:hypothetical protein
MGSQVALVAWIPKGRVMEHVPDDKDIWVKASQVQMLLVKNGNREFVYSHRSVLGEKRAKPNLVNLNAGHAKDGVFHLGGSGPWYVDSRGAISASPGRGKRLEGAVVDLREGGSRSRLAYQSWNGEHVNLVNWAYQALKLMVQNGKMASIPDDEIDAPLLYAGCSGKTFLTVREGNDEAITHRINLRRYDLPGVSDLSSAENGFITFDFKTGGYLFEPADKDSEPYTIENPHLKVQHALQAAFGTDNPVDLHPLFPKAKKKIVVQDQALWSPLKEQAVTTGRSTKDELSAMEGYEVAKQLVIMGAGVRHGSHTYVPMEFAYSDDVWVRFQAGTRLVKFIHNNPRGLKSYGPTHSVDICDTPIRAQMWKDRQARMKKEAGDKVKSKAPGTAPKLAAFTAAAL